MIDETAGSEERRTAPEGQRDADERVAFCQQCGTALTSATVRRVGAAVYCEPCLVERLEGSGAAAASAAPSARAEGWGPVRATVPPPPGSMPPMGAAVPVGSIPPAPNQPTPWLAALLGIIPGVGAMYNGQYAKGVAHLVIFVVLDSLQKNVSDTFGLLVLGWVIYQVVDAYQTARARRDGGHLPNAFGLNDIGDRMGFGRNWPGSSARPATGSTTAGWATAGAGTAPAAGPTAAARSAASVASGPVASSAAPPNWAGYVPPTNFGATAPPPPPPAEPNVATGPVAAGGSASAWTETPSGWTYNGVPWQPAPGAATPWTTNLPPARRFPVGAIWLIGLGLVFLLTNLKADWRLSGPWIAAIVLAALGSWLLFRRVELVRAWSAAAPASDPGSGMTARLLCQIRGPVLLLVLALLFVLQAAGVRTLGQTWAVLLVAFGALLLLERVAGRSAWSPTRYAAGPDMVDPIASSRKDGR